MTEENDSRQDVEEDGGRGVLELSDVRNRKSGPPMVVWNNYEGSRCRQCDSGIAVGDLCWWGAGFGVVCMSCAESNTRRLKDLGL